MIVTIPRAALDIEEGDFTVNFKWSDNMQTDGDIMDFYTNGDVAPGARFKYSFTTLGMASEEPETAEQTQSTEETTPANPETNDETTVGIEGKKGCKSMMSSACILPLAFTGAAMLLRRRKED